MKTRLLNIALLILTFVMAPSTEKVFTNDLEEYILELSKKAIYNILDQEAFDLYLEKKWFPSQLNGIKSESILSVNLIGQIRTYTNLSVLFLDENEVPVEKQIQVKLAGRMRVFIAKIDFDRGTTFKREDIQESWIALQPNFEKSMIQLNNLIGFESNKAIKAGKIIYSHNVIAPTTVKKGQSIQLYKRSGNLELTIDCVTGSDSNIGELIMINCVNLRKKYLGEVISENKAIWRKSL